MYLRTPKQYSPRYRRRRGCISPLRLLFWILAIALIVVGVGIYENRERLYPVVENILEGVVADAGERVATANAPPPTPTEDPTNDYQRAEEAWRRGAIQDSIELYQRVAHAMPNDLRVHYNLALGLLIQGRFNDALDAAEDAITAQPYAPDGWAMRAMALNRLGRSGEAVASALRSLELVPPSAIDASPEMAQSRARALAFLAEAYLALGQGSRAMTTVEQALEAYPDSFEAYQVRGKIHWEHLFDYSAARADLRIAHDLAPNMAYVTIWLARIERIPAFGNDQVAVDLYQQIIEQNPGNTQALFDLGDYNFRTVGNFGEAANYLTRCTQANPESASCHYLLGRAQERMGQLIDAQESFRTAVRLNPDDGYYQYWLGTIYAQLTQCPEALPYLQAAYRIGIENDDANLYEPAASRLQECGSPVMQQQPEVTPDVEDDDAGA
jgi:tetratricopeptide (TPR) repeat protein